MNPPKAINDALLSRGWLVDIFGVALGYFLLARIGQVLAIDPGNVTPVWPASGFALAVVLWRGYGVWPGIWLGNFLGNTWAFFDPSSLADAFRTLATGLAIGPGDIAQVIVGAWLIRRFCRNGDPFGRFQDVFIFAGTQAFSCLFSPTFGVLALCLGGITPWSSYGYTWITWFLGDGVGVLLVAPLLLTLFPRPLALKNPGRIFEFVAILGSAALIAILVFYWIEGSSLAFLPLPVILWAAVRGDHFEVAATVLLITAIAIWGTYHHGGTFATEQINDSFLILQLYTAIMVVTGAAMASIISERRRTEAELHLAREKVLTAVENENIRISAELHDGLGSQLTAIKMGVTLFSNKLKAEEHPDLEDVDLISNQLKAAIQQIRHLAKGLQPVRSDPEALVPALSGLVQQLRHSQSCPGECHFEKPETPVSIPNPSVANQLYRIAQEATHNAIKHSGATQLIVKLSVVDDCLVLDVLDNGIGIGPNLPKSNGLGMHIMTYRARTAGGSLTVRPRPEGGTEVSCTIPMP